jgi:hypothetical protein
MAASVGPWCRGNLYHCSFFVYYVNSVGLYISVFMVLWLLRFWTWVHNAFNRHANIIAFYGARATQD